MQAARYQIEGLLNISQGDGNGHHATLPRGFAGAPAIISGMKHVFVCGYSRSGTTLLTTILDAHPQISMGYELMQPLSDLPGALEALQKAVQQREKERPERALRRHKATYDVGTYLIHSRWARLNGHDLLRILRRFIAEGTTEVRTMRDQARLAMAVVECKREKESAALSGCKVLTSRFGVFRRNFPGSAFVLIARDPRDIVTSQLARGFERSVPQIAEHWRDYVNRFWRFSLLHPRRTAAVRYEDLVNDPEPQYERIFGMLDLDYGDEVRRYWDSKASILHTRHNNARLVGTELSSQSIGRWQEELAAEHVAAVEQICSRPMRRFGYEPTA